MQHIEDHNPMYPSFTVALQQLAEGDSLRVYYVGTLEGGCTTLRTDVVSRDFVLHTLFVNGAYTANKHATRAGWGMKIKHPTAGWMFVPTR